MFIHLHVHCAFSFLYGTFTPEALVQRAKEIYLERPRGKPACPLYHFTHFAQDLICLTGGRDGRLHKLISIGNLDQAQFWLEMLKRIFGPEKKWSHL
ncbi:MAG: hypothetical protein BA872_06335 [Desulfobacterales bacterium C00003060]|nr:MAG: hypothetical protein BA861_04390 [Desulfobacterales bacterium S3730MH5]OEU78680.1 MAG: hypothetical protein BA872_06335 [Desulfobacterales bacterium C00003060]OEU84367.1 MAG: hypothetical protein BA865_11155 [Desulfobacterales bacterium S5133MH4]